MIRKLASALGMAAVTALLCATSTVSAITVTTTNGSGADVQITGWNGPNADPTNVVDSATNSDQLNVRITTNRNEIAVMRVDLTGYTPSAHTNYTLQLVNHRANSAATLFYYAVTDGAVGEDSNGSMPGYTDNNWVETNVLFSTMPGLHWTNTTTAEQTVNGNAVLLGSALMNNVAEGSLASFTSQELNDFMQTNADSVVTFIVLRTDANSTQARFATKESTNLNSGGIGIAGDYAPRLKFTVNGCDPAVVTANPASLTVLVGNTANFAVTATGSSPTYQWQVKTNGTTTWFDITGETADNYTTPATTTLDSGNQYRVVVSVACDIDTAISAAATLTVQALATWNGAASPDTDWSNGGNWDTGLAPGSGTNALVGTGFTITHTNPVALAFKSLTNGSTININTNGFTNNYTWGNVAGGVFNINSGGQMGVGGDLGLFGSAGITLVPGATLNANRLLIGTGSTGGTGSGSGSSYGRVTNNGGTITATSTLLNAPNGTMSSSTGTDASPILIIKGGTSRLGAVTINRAAGNTGNPGTGNALGRDGLIISNGIVEMTSLVVGNNAYGTTLIAGGAVTNTGSTTSTNATTGRPARFLQTGGLYVGSGNLIISPSGTAQAIGSITGGTNIIGGIQLGSATGVVRFTNSGSIYVGANGITHNGTVTLENRLNPGGLFGAQASWTGAAALTLGAGEFTFRAAALDGTPNNITYNSALGGTGPLAKTGGGVLSLNGTNTYSDKTYIREGTLALGALGSLSSSEISLSTGTTLDVTATTYTLPAGKTLSGYGTVTGDVAVASTGIINPGTNNTVAAAGTLTFANSLTQTGGAVTHFDLSVNPVGPSNDVVVIAADLNVGGVNTLELSGGGSTGTSHPLFKYSGAFNGALANFTVTGPSGYLTNITGTPNIIAFVVGTPLRPATNVVWVGNSVQNDWDVQGLTNWLNGAALDFFRNDDSVTFNAVGAANPNVNITALVQPVSVVVNATADYTFSGTGGISGGTSLTKTNSGKLTIQNNHAFSGGVNLNGGTVSVAFLTNASVASPLGASGTINLNGGALEYTGPTASWTRDAVLGATGGTVSVPGSTETLTLGGQLTGNGSLTKIGNGTLALANLASTYTNGTFVNAGVLRVDTAGGAGTGSITINGGILGIGAVKPGNTVDVQTAGVVQGGNGGGLTGISGITGDSDLTIAITTGVFDLIGSMVTFSNTITLSNAGGASLRFNGTTGSSLATFDLGVGTMDLMIRNSLQNVDIGALKGAAGTTLSGRGGASNNGPTTHHIGANNLSTTFDGIIQNGSGGGSSTTAIVKAGTGTLTLTGASTYTGNTTVSNGVLQVNGSLGATTVFVDGGTLAGTGTIGGPVTVNTSGAIAPGASVGTLTVNGSVTLSSGSTTSVEIDAGNATNDLLAVSTTVFYGGTLNVTNLNGTLAAGQVYKLFSAADEFNYIGAFDGGTNLPALGGGLAWDTTGLATNGTISIYSAISVNTTPTNLTFTAGGGNLTISWPSDHTGWTLQTQTNSRSVGLNTNWFDVAGSSATNSVTLPITPTDPTVFYRLFYFIP